jgi:hypothetical protein
VNRGRARCAAETSIAENMQHIAERRAELGALRAAEWAVAQAPGLYRR